MHADDNWRNKIWYEAPREDPEWRRCTLTRMRSLTIRDRRLLFTAARRRRTGRSRFIAMAPSPRWFIAPTSFAGHFTAAPKDAYRAGLRLARGHEWTIPPDASSGYYRVISSCTRRDGSRFVQYHFFVVRPKRGAPRGPILMILPTATWTSYNDWGGASHYIGVDEPDRNQFSPTLSLQRPWTRGSIWLPEGAPRIPISPPPGPLAAPRYPIKEWSYSNGFGYYYAAWGWAQYDRHFVRWAEREGYALDMITQTDLHIFSPEILDNYRCIVIVGHDEYWTHEMRTTIEKPRRAGADVSRRFGGNFLWQVRLEAEWPASRSVTRGAPARRIRCGAPPTRGCSPRHGKIPR